jgi:hypothetical protein
LVSDLTSQVTVKITLQVSVHYQRTIFTVLHWCNARFSPYTSINTTNPNKLNAEADRRIQFSSIKLCKKKTYKNIKHITNFKHAMNGFTLFYNNDKYLKCLTLISNMTNIGG